MRELKDTEKVTFTVPFYDIPSYYDVSPQGSGPKNILIPG